MATRRNLLFTWIGFLLVLIVFDEGESMGPKNRGCDCGETSFSGTSGTVVSPYYPRDYRNNCNCRYIITVTDQNRIRLQFHDIEFGDGACSQDIIRVFDGRSNFASLIGWFCSNRNTPTTMTSTTQRIIITFRSDSRGVGKGFSATYSIVSPTTEAPTTTHITPLPTTATTRLTTQVTTPSMSSTAKSISTVSTSTLKATTTKEAEFPIFGRGTTTDSGPESTVTLVSKRTNEKARTMVLGVSTTGKHLRRGEANTPPNPSTDVPRVQAQSSLLSFAWILPIIFVVVLIVFVFFLLCWIRNKRSVKTSRMGDNGEMTAHNYAQPNVLSADGTTVIVNQTYQSNDDFISNIVFQPVEDDIVKTPTVKTETTDTAVVDATTNRDFQTSPLYQTADTSAPQQKATAHNYDRLLDDTSPNDHQNRDDDSAYQYADINKSEYQYAEGTHRYDYAEAATLPVSTKSDTLSTYEALNPPNKETDGGVSRSTVTDNVHTSSASHSFQDSQYMGLRAVDQKQYQELLMTNEDGFVDNSVYSGTETDNGYLQPNVFKTDGKESAQETGYDLVNMGAYSAVDESSKDKNNLISMERSGTYPNDEAYDVVNVNSRSSATGGQGLRKGKSDNDAGNGETYETLNYRDPSEVNISSNETGYLDYKGNGSTPYQALKPNVNSLFGPKSHGQ